MATQDSHNIDYSDIDLGRTGWLSRFIARFVDDAASLESRLDWSTQIVWAVSQTRHRDQSKSLARATFVQNLHWQLAVLHDLRRQHQLPDNSTPLAIDLAAVLALGADCLDAYLEIRRLLDVVDLGADLGGAALQRQLRAAVSEVGQVIIRSLLGDTHPLLNRSFHHVFTACDTVLLARLSKLHHGRDRGWRAKAERLQGVARVQKMAFVEGIIAMSLADGTMDSVERRLVTELVDMAQFTAEERMLIDASREQPTTPAELARMVVGEQQRGELVKQLLFTAMLDGELSPSEETFLAEVVEAMNLPADKIACLELEVSQVLLSDADIRRGLSFPGLVARLQHHAASRIEQVIRRNVGGLMAEVRETKELMQLLAAATQRPLTAEERTKVHAQLLDIAKTIPSLALFAAPGGTVLVPLMLKVLPFDLLPSAFSEDNTTLS